MKYNSEIFKKIIAGIFFIACYNSLWAQSFTFSETKAESNPEKFIETGIRLHDFYFGNSFLKYDTDIYKGGKFFTHNHSGQGFLPGLSVQKYNKKLLFRFSLNYFRNINRITTSDPINGDYASFSKNMGIEVIPGIGKMLSYGSFTFKYGFDLPVYKPIEYINISSSTTKDVDGNIILNKSIMTLPVKRVISVRTSVFSELEYKIFNNFHLQAGILSGVFWGFSNGKMESVNESYENDQLVNIVRHERKVKRTYISTELFRSYLGLNYRF